MMSPVTRGALRLVRPGGAVYARPRFASSTPSHRRPEGHNGSSGGSSKKRATLEDIESSATKPNGHSAAGAAGARIPKLGDLTAAAAGLTTGGAPARRVPPPREASESAGEKGRGEKGKDKTTRVTAAVPGAGEKEQDDVKDKGKGKADTGAVPDVPPISERSTLTNPGSTSSASSPLSSNVDPSSSSSTKSSTSPPSSSAPSEDEKSSPTSVTTTNLEGPLDIHSIPSLRSSFEEPLVGLSPALSSGIDASSSSGSSSATEFISRSPSTGSSSPPAEGEGEARDAAALSMLPKHSFNTHRFVTRLEQSSFPRPLAGALLSSTTAILRRSQRRILTGADGAVSKPHAEGQAYLYSAALSELRTEVQVKARNDGIALRSVVNGLQREVEALRQRLGEDVGNLRNEIQIEMNVRKEEGSGEMKSLEMGIQELNSKFTILVGDVRTEIEARKWVTTRRCIVAIAGLALAVILYTASLEEALAPTPSSSSTNKSSRSGGTQTTGVQADGDGGERGGVSLRTAEELGIRPSEGDSGGLFWTTTSGAGTRRIGEEEVEEGGKESRQ